MVAVDQYREGASAVEHAADNPPTPAGQDAARAHEQDVPLLQMRGIGKRFPGVVALAGVDLDVRPGQVTALLGENGAGKSTLINVLSGLFGEYDGQILMNGKPVQLHTPTQAQALGISTIHQELNLVPDMSVADNIWLGRELHRGGMVRRAQTNRGASELLARLGLTFSPRRLVRRCRVAEQQLIEVAKALSLNVRVLIMDEPTSALADAEVRKLFDVIRSLTAQNVAVIYISHRLEELYEIADTVTVLRDGRWIGSRPMAEVSREELIYMMVGRHVSEERRQDTGVADAAPRLSVRDLSLQPDPRLGRVGLHQVSFDVRPGEIVGLAGLMGAGRSETLEAIYGGMPRSALDGQVLLSGRVFRPRSPRAALGAGVALVPEDRKNQALLLAQSVRFNTSLSALGSFLRFGWVRAKAERAAVDRQIARLRVKAASPTTAVGTLSGGNQQKVVLAKVLLTQPDVVLLDEPTRGIDVGAKAEIHELIESIAAEGAAVVVASSELPELLRICDRIVVLCEGRVSAELPAGQATQERILAAAMDRHSLVQSQP